MLELYKEIPSDLPPEARLRKLFDACLEVNYILFSNLCAPLLKTRLQFIIQCSNKEQMLR